MSRLYERPVRFEEVDAAQVVFFANFFRWCHEAMERFFDGIEGGYVDLITRRRVGFPAVHLTADYKSPARYGDVVVIQTSVTKVGSTSATFRYELTSKADGRLLATVEHVTVSVDLATMTKIPLPDDCRALLEAART